MKVTFIGHASILVEAGGLRILSDPWWAGPCFGMQWWAYPRPVTAPVEDVPPDYIYISHGHADHLHRGTLSRLPKSAVCLVAAELGLAPALRTAGFEVRELAARDPVALNDTVRIEITPTVGGDSLCVVTDGDETCLNLNDALHSAPRDVQARVADDLNRRYGRADYLFCGYGIASHFPVCIDVPGRDAARTAADRQKYFNRQWAWIVHALSPRFAFPFAADVVFLDRAISWANTAVHNGERPTAALTGPLASPDVQAIDIAPGFAIADGEIASDVRWSPVDNAEIAAAFGDDVETANRSTAADAAAVDELVAKIAANAELCGAYLREVARDYRFLVRLAESPFAIGIGKRGGDVVVSRLDAAKVREADYDVVFRTRYPYVRRALSEAYGHETISVGSGGVFRYRDRADADANLHAELMLLLRVHDAPPRSRFGDQPKWLYALKTGIKRVLRGLVGRAPEPDLYDNRAWIRYRDG